MDLTILHVDVREMAKNLANGAAKEQAEIFARLLRRLAAAGAEIAAVTSMGGHFCIRELAAILPLPLLNAIPEVDATIRQRDLKTVGIIGTRNVTESGLYGGNYVCADRDPRGRGPRSGPRGLHQHGDSRSCHRNSAQRLPFDRAIFVPSEGPEAIVLGGTDLFLAFAGQDCGLPVIDCALVHIEALYRRAIVSD